MNGHIGRLMLLSLLALTTFLTVEAAPPFWGTTSIDPDIIRGTDPSAFESMKYLGRQTRWIFDRRTGMTDAVESLHVLRASFSDEPDIDFVIHPEFGEPEAARSIATYYAHPIGQLPATLRRQLRVVTILKGTYPFGGDGATGTVLIHTGQAMQYVREGILEETLMHEACHVSLDGMHARAPEWIAAQAADDEFISIYARDHPYREDIAESFVPYFGYRYRRDRLSEDVIETIERVMPNRIAYFDEHLPSESTRPSGG